LGFELGASTLPILLQLFQANEWPRRSAARQTTGRVVAAGLCALFIASISLLPLRAVGYELSGSKWRGAKTDFYVSLIGTAPSGEAWQDSFLAALADWENDTVFDFTIIEEEIDPCLEDGLNSVEFTDDVCGSAYGGSTLAVTLRRYIPTLLGEADLFEADVVINNSVEYDIYDGPLYPIGSNAIDFRRVAIHELGHVLGLEHETRERAIMAPSIGDIDRPTEDDLAGVDALYTALQTCAQNPLTFGTLEGSLSSGDCTVDQITAGGTDDSFIDIYRLDLANPASIALSMESAALDSVMLIADLDLSIISFDDKSEGGCSSTLERTLTAGSYLVLANTYDEQINPDCETAGDYALTAHYSGSRPLNLGAPLSTNDTEARGTFTGAASSNMGVTYNTLFSADEAITVTGSIEVAEQDVGETGFVLVAALTGSQTFALDAEGVFVERLPTSGPFPRYKQGALSAIEDITLLDAVVPSELGVSDLEIDFLIGYAVDSDPESIFYNANPIEITIAPNEASE
jgi:hypothetical protein